MRDQPNCRRNTTAASTQVHRKVPVTAMPYAEASASDERNASTRISTPSSSAVLTCGRKICPSSVVEVWVTVMRGRKPSCMHCRAMENAPEISAWLAITVATVASTTRHSRSDSGHSRKNGFSTAAGLLITSAPWPK